MDGRRNPRELCQNCGWTTGNALSSGYTSRVKIIHTHGNAAIWELSPEGPWMLRDEPNEPNCFWSNDYITQQLIKRLELNVPLIEMHKFGGPDDKFHFILMSRAKGSRMDEAWDTLTQQQKIDVKESLDDCIKEYRQIARQQM
ncbi:hypothetical protein BJ875DRAFT_379942 [Amylocarpus encephaloides]|uniref:Uncharacterized protein n=1 Tax=Amylocarpus encephaloides TaxID=45428 RepID=A0A9P7YFM1_9HELO|nr:hypothetical protein BJ875DRAFT_379942 [Amylocarpus encephaloides]